MKKYKFHWKPYLKNTKFKLKDNRQQFDRGLYSVNNMNSNTNTSNLGIHV